MARILILANSDVGLYKFRKELIEKLVMENELYVSLPYGEFTSKLKEMGCKFINTPISRRGTNPITDLKLLMDYIKIIKNIKPNAVLTYTIKPNVYGGLACRIKGIPLLANITGLGSALENGGLLQKVTLLLYRVSLKRASCVFFQNKENKEFLLKKITVSNYQLLPGSGVNIEDYLLLEYPPQDKINFLFIARIMKEKGIDQYLEAAEYIKEKYPNTTFHVLGPCEEAYESKLRMMQEKEMIHYHGMQSDVKKFLRFSHCTIHPTYYPEGMSNVLLESAACGRPIITTNRSGCREIVDDGVNGYIVEQKNSKDLIEKIERFLNLDYDSKRKMGLKGREKIEREFNRQIVVDAYSKTIEKITNK
ncbi:glycosyltransferase family 4 protein [Paenibacillus xylanilyticus]|uniref:Glycosyltransferase family 4 protein n=1 Tax=Paenibacillus xylanilyticus TaxID=248903 RepID=A0A7Y6BUT6_9BACL|nr:glycosyltransferase family 4 protein [Paenibacillus xylanilyticus]NUU75302.1 glycosyltransferase family 4 protein [Paenibacillus xylanilyticus]